MVKQWEQVMDGIEKFTGFQAMNFGRTLFVSFQLIPLVLGDLGCGRRKRNRNNQKEEEDSFNLGKGLFL